MQTVVHRTKRITTILRLLVDQVNVMETMTSLDFLDFRDLLRPASGFQSIQWKELEARLGLRYNERHGKEYYVSQLHAEDVQKVKQVEQEPTLLDLLNAWLERMPYLGLEDVWPGAGHIPAESHPFWAAYRQAYSGSLLHIEQGNMAFMDAVLFGKGEQREGRRLSPNACRAALFIMLYRNFPMLHLPFELLNALQEIDELMATWRARHMNMVFRMIGTRVGTGNSSGRSYLKAALDKHYIFAELSELNGFLLARRDLPKLPPVLEHTLGFAGRS
jgi:tryptophan 2,3-dioxygenase